MRQEAQATWELPAPEHVSPVAPVSSGDLVGWASASAAAQQVFPGEGIRRLIVEQQGPVYQQAAGIGRATAGDGGVRAWVCGRRRTPGNSVHGNGNKRIWISHREAAVPSRGITHGSRCGTWWTVPRKRGAARCWFRRRQTTGSPASAESNHHSGSPSGSGPIPVRNAPNAEGGLDKNQT